MNIFAEGRLKSCKKNDKEKLKISVHKPEIPAQKYEISVQNWFFSTKNYSDCHCGNFPLHFFENCVKFNKFTLSGNLNIKNNSSYFLTNLYASTSMKFIFKDP